MAFTGESIGPARTIIKGLAFLVASLMPTTRTVKNMLLLPAACPIKGPTLYVQRKLLGVSGRGCSARRFSWPPPHPCSSCRSYMRCDRSEACEQGGYEE